MCAIKRVKQKQLYETSLVKIHLRLRNKQNKSNLVFHLSFLLASIWTVWCPLVHMLGKQTSAPTSHAGLHTVIESSSKLPDSAMHPSSQLYRPPQTSE